MPQAWQCFFLSCCESDSASFDCFRMLLLRQQLQTRIRTWMRPPRAGRQPQMMVTALRPALGAGRLSRHSGLPVTQQVGPSHTSIYWSFDSAAAGALSNTAYIVFLQQSSCRDGRQTRQALHSVGRGCTLGAPVPAMCCQAASPCSEAEQGQQPSGSAARGELEGAASTETMHPARARSHSLKATEHHVCLASPACAGAGGSLLAQAAEDPLDLQHAAC